MSDRTWETDEDFKQYKLEVHKRLIGWTIQKLQERGVHCARTIGDDPNGDIVYYSPEDEPIVKEVVRELQKQYNS